VAQRITRFSVAQTAKVFAVIYGLLGLLFTPFFLLANAFAPEGQGGFGTIFALAFPVIYAVLGYLGVALGCAIYNLVAGWVGGIEVELDQS
jgi:hypothetical protein